MLEPITKQLQKTIREIQIIIAFTAKNSLTKDIKDDKKRKDS